MDTQIDSLRLAVGNLDLLANHKVLSIKEVGTRSEPLLTFRIFLGLRTLSCPKERRLGGSRKDIPTWVASIKCRSTRNSILSLKVGNGWIEGVAGIRHGVFNHFYYRFKEPNVDYTRLDGAIFRSIDMGDNLALTSLFLLRQVDEIVYQRDENNSPCPNGSNFSFFKNLWILLTEDMGILISEFHCFASLPHNFASYFVTLIPKIKNPFSLGEFWHISLIESLYNLDSKFLEKKLVSVILQLLCSQLQWLKVLML